MGPTVEDPLVWEIFGNTFTRATSSTTAEIAPLPEVACADFEARK